ncbi:MAG TPA: DUF6600 domain-containing protein [Candidatus Acidoferrum sp.]|nr:DUF6600 domain-containing protein [Candidatus Acidoferrum sp.]
MSKTTFTGKFRLALLLCLTGLLSLLAPNAPARQSEQTDAGDPPTRVARISYLDGSVSIQPGGEGDWGGAVLNRPMTIGDKLWTDKDSRAELQTGVVSIHLGSMTALSFLNLDQNITQMRLAEGSVNFRIKEIREGDVYEVDTPNLAFTIREAGAFRIDVNENGDSTGITVIRGAGQVTASGKTYDLEPGQRGVFDGTDDVQSTIAQAPPADGLDQWANDRDLREQDSISAQYVPPDTPGTADLDNNGTWSEEPDYGHVWYPSDVPDDWAPYSDGNWSYVGPWGWTWVDYEPWGFAPFHYGRWSYIGGRWGWCPGPIFGPAIYGPAFVGFVGGGFGFDVGWFPLGYGEPFNPWFRCGRGFVERINVRNTFIRNRGIFTGGNFHNFNYAYARNARAVTASSRGDFTGGRRINRGAAHLTDASLRGARVTNDLRLSPGRQSSFGAASARGNIARPPMSVQNRSVMARTAPARGASDMRVRTINTNRLTPGRAGNFSPTAGLNRSPNNGGAFTRQNDLSRNRPPSAAGNDVRMQNSSPNRVSSQRVTNGTHTWEAQGSSTDRGRGPQGFGSSNSSNNISNNARITERTNRQDRPPGAGSGASANYGGSRSNGPANRPAYSGGNRSFEPPQRTAPSNNRGYSPQERSNSAPARSYSAPNRSYPAPSRSYSAPQGSYSAPSRSYSAPSRSYSAPQRNYSAPSRSYSAPQRNYSAPSRSYSAPQRSYSAPSRSYSAPQRSYSAPSRSYSAPSHSSGGGGGGGSRGSGGGGTSHGSGGGGGRPHR